MATSVPDAQVCGGELFAPRKASTQTAHAEPRHAGLGFLAVLERMTPAERLSASRHGGFSRRERAVWVSRYPEEAPLVNGELEWIVLNGADLD